MSHNKILPTPAPPPCGAHHPNAHPRPSSRIDESRRIDEPLPARSNTDWIGIRNLLVDTLKSRGLASKPQELTALVMGGGGTARAACYALQQMKVGDLHVYNRSTEKVREASLAPELCNHRV